MPIFLIVIKVNSIQLYDPFLRIIICVIYDLLEDLARSYARTFKV